MRLNGKVAIVTGGANGIGAETARVFAAEGATVDAWDVAGHARRVDVTDPDSVKRAVDAVVKAHGRIDVLVNNAGIVRDATLLKLAEEDLDAVLRVNLKGVIACTRAVAPVMVAQGSGRILNATSIVGIYGNFGQTAYVASKAAVIGVTRVWARELGPKGICVNAVAPGFIATQMVQGMPEKVLAGMRERTPLRRFGEPRDVALAYLYLASDDAAFVNGAVLSVDGGLVVGT